MPHPSPADAPGGPPSRAVLLRVDGMTCGGCVGRVRDALAAAPGVQSADVTLDPPRATVALAPGAATTAADLVAAVDAVGKTAAPLHEETVMLRVDGMTCGGCVGRVRDALAAASGVQSADVTLNPPRAAVVLAPGAATTAADLVAAVDAVGKTAAPLEEETVMLRVDGMTCGSCVGRVRDALAAASGVQSADVTLDPPHATVVLAPGAATTATDLVAAVDAVGKTAAPLEEETVMLRVDGMTCGGCVGRVRDALAAAPGVQSADVTLDPPRATVVLAPGAATTAADLVAAVDAVGKTATPLQGESATTKEKTVLLRVAGMTCNACVGRVRDALAAVSGVQSADVTLDPPRATVVLQAGSLFNAGDLIAVVAAVGKSAVEWVDEPQAKAVSPPDCARTDPVVLQVKGMTCGSCVRRVKDALGELPGVDAVDVTLDPPRATVLLSKVEPSTLQTLISAVAETGKSASLPGFPDGSIAAAAVSGGADDVPPQSALHFVPSPLRQGPMSPARRPLTHMERALVPPLSQTQAPIVLAVRGMTCSSCVGIVERLLVSRPRVISARVNLLAARANIVVEDPVKEGDAESLAEAVRAAGYNSEILEDGLRAPVDDTAGRVLSVACADNERANRVAEVLRDVRDECGIDGVVVPNGSQYMRVSLVCGKPLAPVVRALEDAPPALVGPFVIAKVSDERNVAEADSFTTLTSGDSDSAELLGSSRTSALAPGRGSCAAFCSIESSPEDESAMWRSRCLLGFAFSAPLMFLNMFGMSRLHIPPLVLYWVMFALATPVQFVCGRGFYRASYFALRKGRATMDVLIALSTSIAYGTSALVVILSTISTFSHVTVDTHARGIGKTPMFNVSAMIVTLVLVGKWLESIAKRRAAAGIAALSALAPKDAILYDMEARRVLHTRIPVDILRVGDIVRVGPGERVPVDAVVVEGHSAINESMLTGESTAVPKEAGDFVYGGTTNGLASSGSLLVRTSAIEQDAVLAQIVKLVDDAQTSRAPIEAFADKVSAVFVPGVVSLSLLVFIVWYSLARLSAIPIGWFDREGAFTFALLFALETMVIACPCALGLATPTAVMVASEVSTKLGILFRGGGAALEAAQGIRTVLFDKTGTLTMGTPKVTAVIVGTQAHSEPRATVSSLVSCLTYVVEAESRHPLASAIVEYVAEQRHAWSAADSSQFVVSETEELPGRGMRAELNGGKYKVRIGSRPWALGNLDRKLLTSEELAAVQRLEREDGLTIVSAVVNDTYVVMFGLEDTVRPEAYDVVRYLQQNLGVTCGLVTGDSDETAQAVARKVGIDPRHVTSRAMPWTKVDAIKALPHGTACFVGDGINDAPALAAADVSIAIGAGAPIAAENASVVLVRSDLNGVVQTLDLARTSFARVRLNFMWALGYNLLGIPLAAGALYPLMRIRVPPIVASASMALSSSCVIASSMALRLYKPPELNAWAGGQTDAHDWSESISSEEGGRIQDVARELTTRRDRGPSYVLVEDERRHPDDKLLPLSAAISAEDISLSTTPVSGGSSTAFVLE